MCFGLSSFSQQHNPKKITSNITSSDVFLPKSGENERCLSDQIHQRQIANDPNYKSYFEIESTPKSQSSEDEIYVIPLVIHVLHLGEEVGEGSNISDAQIHSAIERLNESNGAENTGVDTKIRFCLAAFDPNGLASNGINRIDASNTSDYLENGITNSSDFLENELEIKTLSTWDNQKYYNIWVVSEINGNDAGGGTQGYAYLPLGTNPFSLDGTVIVHNAIGYDPDGSLGYSLKIYTRYNITLTHELGHALGLRHTFLGDENGSCPSNDDCSQDGDYVCDTDPHTREEGLCSAEGETCFGAGTDLTDVATNFMAYSSDICQTKFSEGQKNRMRQYLEEGNFRHSLTTNPELVCDIDQTWDCVEGACIDPLDENGEYAAQAQCIDNCTSIGIQNNNSITTNIFPNPSTGVFYLDVKPEGTEQIHINITNALGQTVYFETLKTKVNFTHSVDLSKNPIGVYFLNLNSNNTTKSYKLIHK
jgi:hypothetical protein